MRWRCPTDREGESGTVTAELAVAVPAVLLVLAACVGGLRVGVERLRVVDAAAQGARAVALGGAADAAAAAVGGRVVGSTSRDEQVCVTVSSGVPLLGLPLPVTATSCALAGVRATGSG